MPGNSDDAGGPDYSFIALSRDGQSRTPREVARLIAAVSHELISPVSNIAGFSRLLATDPQANLDDKTRDLVMRIRRNAVRLAHLIDEAATIARLTWELEETAREPIDLRAIIEGALKDTAEVTGAAEPGPDVHLPEGALPATGDGRRLRVAFGGLFLNLAKDLNTRRITVTLDRADDRWRVVAWHASPDKDDAVFAQVEGDGGGPSAVIVMELFRAIGCEGRVCVSPEGARKIEILLPR